MDKKDTYIRMYIDIDISACKHTHTCIHIYTYIYTHSSIYMYVCRRIYGSMHMYEDIDRSNCVSMYVSICKIT